MKIVQECLAEVILVGTELEREKILPTTMGGNISHYASGRSGLELSEALYPSEPFK